jgi:DNA-binding response OmpR family regulator
MTWKDKRPAGEAPLSGQQILVVEDEPLIALELGRMLNDAGAVVVGPVRDLAESLKLARREPPLSAALLDVRLGRETVAPLAQLLQDGGVPFAFYTGEGENDALRLEWPAAPVITKPSPARQVLAVVERLCHAAG